MSKAKRYALEIRKRAVYMMLELEKEDPSQDAVISMIGGEIGMYGR